ncbi:MAG: alanine--tRNA ligase [Planctomycetes bacterium]|nr:alanine--tRNA ligase [Planctomycetota bacterium]
MPTSNEIRRQYLDFFASKCGHTIVPSAPVVPHEDPTLLFTNAGMNQFKDVFLGVGERPYTRAVDTQKCIRAGGKHNDLDDVGKDTYHHTFFEMLGNWSFGDYFKTEAINWAWELLTKVWGMDPTRLHATYFQGNEAEGLAPDEEAKQLWLSHLPPERVHPGNMKDNFWEMGDTGPCGPCSEIHVDLTPDKSGASLVNGGDARVIEIWNLVFIQFNRDTDGSLASLPAKHVDTGMGFERLCAVLQGKSSNYDSDVFAPLFAAIQQITGAPAYSAKLHSAVDVAYRVIADHARCLTFAITDGAMPSNEGRGYVLRRILRRAVRYGRQNLNIAEPFMHRLVPVIADQMGDVFPELREDPGAIAAVIRDEEESFGKTLERGIELFEAACGLAQNKQITAADAFRLYDTFGFPLDLTQLMAEERGMKVDVAGFNTLMDEARQRSRGDGGQVDAKQSLFALVHQGDLPATKFVGYDANVADDAHAARVLVLNGPKYERATALRVGHDAAIVVDATPFYAESGGQVGDRGTIHSTHGAVFQVNDTIKVGDVYFHLGQLDQPNIHRDELPFTEEDPLLLEIDQPRRNKIMAHHSSTHLLNWALREVLGDHIAQKGSLVDDEKTRFDFSQGKALTAEEIAQVQKHVNEQIEAALPIYIDLAPQEEALKINSLRAVFGEKYPPMVRVVSMGAPVKDLLAEPGNDKWRRYSIEFCGGTHLKTTKDAQRFAIVSEEAVAKGVRRITAVAGDIARRAFDTAAVLAERIDAIRQEQPASLEQDLAALTDAVNTTTLPLLERASLRAGLDDLQKIIKEHRKTASKQAEGGVVENARKIADDAAGNVIVAMIDGADANTLRTAMDVIRKKRPEAAMMLAAAGDDKVSFLASVPEAMIGKGLKAGDWVREVAKVTGGGGGGRPDMAQAGGKNPAKLNDALTLAREFAAAKLG